MKIWGLYRKEFVSEGKSAKVKFFIIVRILGYAAFVFPVFMVIGIINVVNGQEKELPVIGKVFCLQ